jgi:diaminohydroxyphosphoribosylaminopyrimidine deaminase/5-amino-6-(5-phosphoribosylamino)uracil reductase
MESAHDIFIKRCFDLAALGLGNVSPNPLVGAVLVKNGQIIGEGYHQKIGEAHAEVNAIASVKKASDLKDATLYVNLEPCVHHGKTPPCTDLIIRKGIPRVVISMTDPNPKVAGKGIEKLRANGVEVISGVLEDEAKYLNRRFIRYMTTDRPYVILKWAKTEDGFMDVLRPIDRSGAPSWITNAFCKQLVHKWRAEEDAFMVGKHTAIMDNPQLTVREWTGRNPKRVSIDFDDNLPKDLEIFTDASDNLIFTGNAPKIQNRTRFFQISSRKDNLEEILRHLHREMIQSLVVEGGSELLHSFIDKGLWDEARVFTGNHYFRRGIKAPQIQGVNESHQVFGNSRLKIVYNKL